MENMIKNNDGYYRYYDVFCDEVYMEWNSIRVRVDITQSGSS